MTIITDNVAKENIEQPNSQTSVKSVFHCSESQKGILNKVSIKSEYKWYEDIFK